jgi:hypothetical protein
VSLQPSGTGINRATQVVEATLAWSFVAGVWNPKVFLGP